MRSLWLLTALFLVACAGDTATAPPAKAPTITCTAAYRPDVGQAIQSEESISFGQEDGEQALSFADLVFHAAYHAGELDNERALRVWITDSGETATYHTHLYQLPQDSGPQNQFIGGHGFTGLGYTYHPVTGAELQYWCAAGGLS
jgi:hypothetical protein